MQKDLKVKLKGQGHWELKSKSGSA